MWCRLQQPRLRLLLLRLLLFTAAACCLTFALLLLLLLLHICGTAGTRGRRCMCCSCCCCSIMLVAGCAQGLEYQVCSQLLQHRSRHDQPHGCSSSQEASQAGAGHHRQLLQQCLCQLASQLQLHSLHESAHVTATNMWLVQLLLAQLVQLLHGCRDAARCELMKLDAQHCLQLQQAVTGHHQLRQLLHVLPGMQRANLLLLLLLLRGAPGGRHVLLKIDGRQLRLLRLLMQLLLLPERVWQLEVCWCCGSMLLRRCSWGIAWRRPHERHAAGLL